VSVLHPEVEVKLVVVNFRSIRLEIVQQFPDNGGPEPMAKLLPISTNGNPAFGVRLNTESRLIQ
jgi:hypothetical protein